MAFWLMLFEAFIPAWPLRFSGSEVYADPECLLSHLVDVYTDSMKESARLYDKRKNGGAP